MAKHPGGRPPWIPPSPEKVQELAERGLTLEQIAHCLGISYQTLNEKSKEYAEFADAIKRGRDKGISIIANSLFENAKSGNVAAQIFYLKARAGWTDKEIEDKKPTEILYEIKKDIELLNKCVKPVP